MVLNFSKERPGDHRGPFVRGKVRNYGLICCVSAPKESKGRSVLPAKNLTIAKLKKRRVRSIMSEAEIINRLRESIGAEHVFRASVPRARRVFVDVDERKFRDAVRFLKDEGFSHLSTITGLEVEDGIELLYHLNRGGIELTVRIKLPLENPVVPTITDVIPGSVLYEREVHDLLGVKFEGHPNLARLILPDEWPEHVHPLRKHWSAGEIRKDLSEKRKRV